MFCYKCGTRLAAEAVFCHQCGTKVVNSDILQQHTAAIHPSENDPKKSISQVSTTSIQTEMVTKLISILDKYAKSRSTTSIQTEMVTNNNESDSKTSTEFPVQASAQYHMNELTFLGNRFEITDELATYISIRKLQEQTVFEIETRYLAAKDKMLAELLQIVRSEEKKYSEAVQNDIKTLQQAAETGMNELLTTFQAATLPEIGQRIVFKYTKNSTITSKEISHILFAEPTALYLDVYDGFFENVYNDIEQINTLRQGLKERRDMSRQCSTPIYKGYGFGIRGTINAAMGATATNFGMSMIQGFSDGLTASSDDSMIKQRSAQGLTRAKQDLLIMGQEQVKKLTQLCLNYLFKDMQAEIDDLGITSYHTFQEEELATIQLRNENYDEAFREGDIGPERYVAHIFRELERDPYNRYHYCHLVKAAFIMGDQDSENRILAFAEQLGLSQPVRQMLELESTEKMAGLSDLGENNLEQITQKIAVTSKLYGTVASAETKRLQNKLKCLQNVPKVREKALRYQMLIDSNSATVFVMPDRTVASLDQKAKIGHLKNVVSVSTSGEYILALNSDGTVSCGGPMLGRPEIKRWKDIVAINASSEHCVGLKKDGTVVSTGRIIRGARNVDNWQDIVAIACASEYTVGVKNDGTVVACGQFNESFKVDLKSYLSSWQDIVSVAAGENHALGLKKDGTVVGRGLKNCDHGQCNVDDWWGIAAIAVGRYHSVGLQADGTVVAVGSNDCGQCNVGDWRNIVAIACGYNHTVGLKADGTLIAVGYNKDGRCNLSEYRLHLN